MTRAEIKRLLHSYRDLKAEHQQITMELDQADVLMISISSPSLDGLPRAAGPGDPTATAALRLAALKDRYRAQLARLAERQAMVEDIISSLDPRERVLFRYRYIDGLTWEQVCVAVGYSWRQTHNIHRAALDKLEQAYTDKALE